MKAIPRKKSAARVRSPKGWSILIRLLSEQFGRFAAAASELGVPPFRVEGLLREPTHGAIARVSDQMRVLALQGIPLVFVSAWGAREMRQLQDEFAFDQPFICEEGAALHALLTVGIGRDLADYALLREVDIPIVVRDVCRSQPQLVDQLPGVYVTEASGAAGWSEAVLGGAQ